MSEEILEAIDEEELEYDFIPIFVGGPTGSGVELVHSIMASSENCNDYYPAATNYFSNLLRTYISSRSTFESSANCFFNSEEEFDLYNVGLLDTVYGDYWHRCGTPENLILKDTSVTKDFPILRTLFPEARFVVVIRNPLDILASIKSILFDDIKEIDEEQLESLIRNEILLPYSQILGNMKDFESSIVLIKYEEIIESKVYEGLNSNLEIEVQADKIEDVEQDAVGIYKEVLTEKEIEMANEFCHELLEAFEYQAPPVK